MRMVKCLAVMAVIFVGFVMAGCNLSTKEAKAVAKTAGLYSAVGWIALDNPNTNEMKGVVSVFGGVEEKVPNVQTGQSYVIVLYPELEKVIDKDIEKQYRPLCKSGCLSLLGGIDILFATNSEWRKDQALTIDLIKEYIVGSKEGLSLKDNNPIMIQAKNVSARRFVGASGEVKTIIKPNRSQTWNILIVFAAVAISFSGGIFIGLKIK